MGLGLGLSEQWGDWEEIGSERRKLGADHVQLCRLRQRDRPRVDRELWAGRTRLWDTLPSTPSPSLCFELAHPAFCFPDVTKVFCLSYTVFSWGERATFKSQETAYFKEKNCKIQNCGLFWKNSKDLTVLALYSSMVTAAGACSCRPCDLCFAVVPATPDASWTLKPEYISVSFFVPCAALPPCRDLYICRWFLIWDGDFWFTKNMLCLPSWTLFILCNVGC